MLFLPQEIRPVTVRPPVIATAVGITVGLTTTKDFERRYGKGQVMMGGHSGGARVWYDTRNQVVINADGFNYSSRGEVIDGFTVEWSTRRETEKGVPSIRLPQRVAGLIARFHKGMSKADVEKAIGVPRTQWPVKRSGLIRYSTNLVNKGSDRYTRWELRFTFGDKGLVSFTILGD